MFTQRPERFLATRAASWPGQSQPKSLEDGGGGVGCGEGRGRTVGYARPLNKRNAAQRFEWFSQSNFHFGASQAMEAFASLVSQKLKIHRKKNILNYI